MRYTFIFLLSCVLILSSCKRNQSQTQTTQASSSFAVGSPEAKGEALFKGKGRCSSCHSLAADTTIVGPSLAGIADSAGARVSGLDARTYLLQSVLQPDAYRPPGFEQKQMDSSLAKSLTSEELDDIVNYLMTIKN